MYEAIKGILLAHFRVLLAKGETADPFSFRLRVALNVELREQLIRESCRKAKKLLRSDTGNEKNIEAFTNEAFLSWTNYLLEASLKPMTNKTTIFQDVERVYRSEFSVVRPFSSAPHAHHSKSSIFSELEGTHPNKD
jgi:hypothetical protein